MEELKEGIALNATVEHILEFARIQRFGSKPNDAELKHVHEEGTNTTMGSPKVKLQARSSSLLLPSMDNVPDTAVVGDSAPLSRMRLDPVEDDMIIGGG